MIKKQFNSISQMSYKLPLLKNIGIHVFNIGIVINGFFIVVKLTNFSKVYFLAVQKVDSRPLIFRPLILQPLICLIFPCIILKIESVLFIFHFHLKSVTYGEVPQLHANEFVKCVRVKFGTEKMFLLILLPLLPLL